MDSESDVTVAHTFFQAKPLEDTLKSLERKTNIYYEEFYEKTKKDTFSIDNIDDVESMFKVNVKLYSKLPSGSVRKVYCTLDSQYDDTIYLNVFGKKQAIQHVSYVRDPTAYLKVHQCRHCEKIFSTLQNVSRHEKVCFENVKLILKHETFLPQRTVMETLLDMDLIQERIFYPFF